MIGGISREHIGGFCQPCRGTRGPAHASFGQPPPCHPIRASGGSRPGSFQAHRGPSRHESSRASVGRRRPWASSQVGGVSLLLTPYGRRHDRGPGASGPGVSYTAIPLQRSTRKKWRPDHTTRCSGDSGCRRSEISSPSDTCGRVSAPRRSTTTSTLGSFANVSRRPWEMTGWLSATTMSQRRVVVTLLIT